MSSTLRQYVAILNQVETDPPAVEKLHKNNIAGGTFTRESGGIFVFTTHDAILLPDNCYLTINFGDFSGSSYEAAYRSATEIEFRTFNAEGERADSLMSNALFSLDVWFAAL